MELKMNKDNFLRSYLMAMDETTGSPGIEELIAKEPEHRASILRCLHQQFLINQIAGWAYVFRQFASPIEELFCAAIAFYGYQNAGGFIINYPGQDVLEDGDPHHCIEIWPQYQIGDYRVDFYIELQDAQAQFRCKDNSFRPKIVVECDGHDFHEKTKEQAQKDKERDRTLQSCGYPVFRFSGSEIWEDPFKCAKATLDFLNSKLAEQILPR
jgi:very-short-patch-repair endonuclease